MSAVDVLIIGGGPAGLSAALTLVRQHHTVRLFDTNECRAASSTLIHGHTGWDHKSPADYIRHAHEELKAYTSFNNTPVEVTNLAKTQHGFEAKDSIGKTYLGRKILLANGVVNSFPEIPGYTDCWGKGIFHNLFAQAYQEDPTKAHCGILGIGMMAMPKFTLHFTHMASQLAQSVTIYTNGNTELAEQLIPLIDGKPWKTDSRKITKLALNPAAGECAIDLHFEDGEKATEAFVGHSPASTVRGPFHQQLGIKLTSMDGQYETNGPFYATSVSGVYAAGDVVTTFKVWPNAVATGSIGAAGVAVQLQEEKWGLPSILGP